MTGTPQVIVTLDPSGNLVAELPGANGSRRQVPLQSGESFEAALHRVLAAQLRGETKIGTDGAPDARQLRHWQRHGIWTDPMCPHCIAEGRISAPKATPAQKLERALAELDSRRAPDGAYREFAGKRSRLAKGETWAKLARQRLLTMKEKSAPPLMSVTYPDGTTVRRHASVKSNSLKNVRQYRLIDNPAGLLPLVAGKTTAKPQGEILDLEGI